MVVQYNPLLPEILADPYPVYHQLRSQEPVYWSELMGVWLLTRYADVVSVLRDPRFSADRTQADHPLNPLLGTTREEMGPLDRALTTMMLFSDPPTHTRMRTLVNKAFTPRVVEGRRQHIQEIVDERLDAVQAAGRMDVIRDLAYPLPVIVIAEMLGVPPEDRDRFKQWSDDLAVTIDPIVTPEARQRGERSVLELTDYLHGVIEERRRSPRDDLLSALIAAEEQGDALSEGELFATCILLLGAGNETTTNLIGNGLLALLRHPDQMERLRDDPSLIRTAVEELLRYDGPVQMTGRVAREELAVGGRKIGRRQVVGAILAAADRDPEQFPDPDRLDVGRGDNRHLAFGYGIHFCLGAPLARVEGQIAINTVLRRLPGLQLQTEAPEWRQTIALRGLKSLPVAF